MPTRREQLFKAKQVTASTNVIPATVQFRHNKKLGILEPLRAEEKMLCALRKALAKMSDNDPNGRRYYIAGNKVQVTNGPTSSTGREDGPRSYIASGRCRLGVAHPGHVTMINVEFTISYRDIVDDRGLADVEFFEPTTIDTVGSDTPIDMSALA